MSCSSPSRVCNSFAKIFWVHALSWVSPFCPYLSRLSISRDQDHAYFGGAPSPLMSTSLRMGTSWRGRFFHSTSSPRMRCVRGQGTKVFVGKLPRWKKKTKLRDRFGKFGELTDLGVISRDPEYNSPGFGFVKFLDNHEAQKVLEMGRIRTDWGEVIVSSSISAPEVLEAIEEVVEGRIKRNWGEFSTKVMIESSLDHLEQIPRELLHRWVLCLAENRQCQSALAFLDEMLYRVSDLDPKLVLDLLLLTLDKGKDRYALQTWEWVRHFFNPVQTRMGSSAQGSTERPTGSVVFKKVPGPTRLRAPFCVSSPNIEAPSEKVIFSAMPISGDAELCFGRLPNAVASKSRSSPTADTENSKSWPWKDNSSTRKHFLAATGSTGGLPLKIRMKALENFAWRTVNAGGVNPIRKDLHETVIGIWETIRLEGFQLTAGEYNAVIKAFCAIKEGGRAFDVEKESEKRGISLYDNYQLDVYYAFSQVELAREYCRYHLRRSPDTLPPQISVLYMNGLAVTNETEHLIACFGRLEQMGLLTAAHFNIMLKHFGYHKRLQMVQRYYSLMLSQNLKPDNTTLVLLVKAFGVDSDKSKVVGVAKMHTRLGKPRNAKWYENLLRAYAFRVPDLPRLISTFKCMLEDGLTPNSRCVRSLVVALVHADRHEEAIATYHQLRRNVLTSIRDCDDLTLCMLISSFAYCGRVEGSQKIFKEVCEFYDEKHLRTRLKFWVHIIYACVECSQIPSALDYYQRLRAHGHRPPIYLCERLVHALMSFRFFEDQLAPFVQTLRPFLPTAAPSLLGDPTTQYPAEVVRDVTDDELDRYDSIFRSIREQLESGICFQNPEAEENDYLQ